MDTTSKWYMGGSDGSGEYVVIAIGANGNKVGYRDIHDKGKFRIRIDLAPGISPASISAIAEALPGWNKPNPDNMRFSCHAGGMDNIKMALSRALTAAGCVGGIENPGAPEWATELVNKPVKFNPDQTNYESSSEDEDEPSGEYDEDEPEDDDGEHCDCPDCNPSKYAKKAPEVAKPVLRRKSERIADELAKNMDKFIAVAMELSTSLKEIRDSK